MGNSPHLIKLESRYSYNPRVTQIPVCVALHGALNCWQENLCGPDECVVIATSNGTISLLLRHQVRVDMTVDRGIRVTNFKVSDLSTVNK
jgi:hypothetical protein